MEPISVREADTADIQEIVNLVKTLPEDSKPVTETIQLLSNQNVNVTETIIRNQIESKELNLYVAIINGKVCGMVYLNHTTNYIGHFYLQNNNPTIQQALLNTLIEEANKYHLPSLVVKTHIESDLFIETLESYEFKLLNNEVPTDNILYYVKNLL